MMDTDRPERETTSAARKRPSKAATAAAYALACLAPLISAALYIQATISAGVSAGFPLDDSWIHAQYARTLVEGRPFQYVPGIVSVGTTSVLFDIVWAAATSVTGEYLYTIYVVNTLLTCALGAVLVAMLLRFGLPALTAGAGAALIVTCNPFPWSSLSGMETALAALLTTAALLAHCTWGRKTGWREAVAPVLIALSAMTRPENLVLFPLSEVDRLLLRYRDPHRTEMRKALSHFGIRFAAFGVTMLPYFALNYSVHGAPVPNTYAAKVGNVDMVDEIETEGIGGSGYRLHVAWETAYSALWFVAEDDNKLLFVFAFVGALMLFFPRDKRPRAADSLLPPLLFLVGSAAVGMLTLAVFFPGQNQRYLIQWIPALLIYGVVGMHLVSRGIGALFGAATKPVYAALMVLLLAGNVFVMTRLYPKQVAYYIASVKNINEMQVALGKWVDENTPEDAVIATNDIGAIAFFGNRPIVDTIGLIDPEVVRLRRLPNHTEAMLEYMKERNVTYALLFPLWHPDLILDPHLKPIHRVALDDNVICGDHTMIVSKVDWALNEPQAAGPAWVQDELAACKRLMKFKKLLPF